jgi:hypothetical protein
MGEEVEGGEGIQIVRGDCDDVGFAHIRRGQQLKEAYLGLLGSERFLIHARTIRRVGGTWLHHYPLGGVTRTFLHL